MKKKFLLSPLLIVVLIIVLGVGVAGAAILISGGGNTENVNLQKGLVGWWKLDANAKDSSPYANDGTVTGAVLTTDRKGTANKAYSFDASSSSIDCGTGSVLNLATNITASAWIYSAIQVDTSTDRRIVDKFNTNWSTYMNGFTLRLTATNKVYWSFGTASTIDALASATNSVPIGSWVHVAATYNGSVAKIYINGVEKATKDSAVGLTSTTTAHCYIGGVTSSLFNGYIDDVRIYNRVLSATEMTALYESYDPGIVMSDLQKGLIAHWKMDGNAKDSTPYGNDGTVSGATLTTDRKGGTNKAYSFNGSTSVITVSNFGTKIPSNEITIAVWVKPGVESGNDDLLCTDPFEPGGSSNRMNIHFPWGSTIIWQFGEPFAGTSIALNASWANVWGHYVFQTSVSGNFYKIYRNGVQVATSSTSVAAYNPTTQATLRIGGRVDYPFQGEMDDLRIYNRALSPTEVTALYEEYDSGIVVSDLQKGLVLQWAMDGGAKDSTPYGNDGTVTNATLTVDRKGQVNKAYDFNGTNANIVKASPTGINFDYNTPFTASAWVKTTASSATNTDILGKMGANNGIVFMYTNSGRFDTLLFGDNVPSKGFRVNTTATINDNTWKHLVVTYDGSNTAAGIKQYINGVSQAQSVALNNPTTDTWVNTASLAISGRQWNNIWLPGSVDDVRIYNRALSAAEVLALYESY